MDPNANLQEQERILTDNQPGYRFEDDVRLGELREALAEWLASGGFAPDWAVCPRATRWFQRRGMR